MIEREREFSYIKTAQLQNADFFQKTKIMLLRERERESSAMGQTTCRLLNIFKKQIMFEITRAGQF
jgi:hypothetical protein